MRLFEITRPITTAKKKIDKLYISYTTSNSRELSDQIIMEIEAIYPTGYPNIDRTLAGYRNAIHADVMNLLITGGVR